MLVDLDTHELFYLLDNCLRGSHLRSGTIERFVNEWYFGLSEHQRMNLFEWAVRLSYAWSGHGYFEPQSSACGKDIIFMKRYHPENQYKVKLIDEKNKPTTVRAFKMDGKYHIGCGRFCADEYITNIEKVNIPEWEEYKQSNIDYDKNILPA